MGNPKVIEERSGAIRPNHTQTIEQQIKSLNGYLSNAKMRLHVCLIKRKEGTAEREIAIRYKIDIKWQRATLLNMLDGYAIARGGVKGTLFGDNTKTGKESDQNTINRLYTILPDLWKRIEYPGLVKSSTTIEEYVQKMIETRSTPTRFVQLQKWLNAETEGGTPARLPKTPLSKFNVFCLRQFIGVLRHGKLKQIIKKNQTAKNILSTLNVVLNEAVRADLIEVNPFVKLKKYELNEFKVSNEEKILRIKYLEPDDVKKLAHCYEKNEPRLPKQTRRALQVFLFQVATGIRCGDVLNLKWENIDRKENRIIFTEQKTKNNRNIPLIETARKYLPEFDKNTMKSTDRVFAYFKENTKNAVTCIDSLLKKKVEPIVGKHLSTHKARHTFATLMLSLTNDLTVVQDAIGHSQIQTSAIYAKVLEKTKAEANKKYNAFLDSITK